MLQKNPLYPILHSMDHLQIENQVNSDHGKAVELSTERNSEVISADSRYGQKAQTSAQAK